MEITNDLINKSSILAEGTTSYIMQHESGITYKLYKGAINYISGKSEYPFDEQMTSKRLNYIISKQHDVTLTDLPHEIMSYNNKPVGVSVTYYDNGCTLKNYLENKSNVDLSLIKQTLTNIVGELIEHGIVPTDPHFENFIVCYDKNENSIIKMIDLDDNYVSVYPEQKRDVWYETEKETCYRVIDLSFENLNNAKKH